jgi:hypothetical protein
MKMEFIEQELNQLFKRGYWNSRYTSEIRRLHNIAPPKGRAKVKRSIAEKIAGKVLTLATQGHTSDSSAEGASSHTPFSSKPCLPRTWNEN